MKNRRVKVTATDTTLEADFLGFGTKNGNTTAIVEYQTGTVELVHVGSIQFIKEPFCDGCSSDNNWSCPYPCEQTCKENGEEL